MNETVRALLESENHEDNCLAAKIILKTRDYPEECAWKKFTEGNYDIDPDLVGLWYRWGPFGQNSRGKEYYMIKEEDGTYSGIMTEWGSRIHFHREMDEYTYKSELKFAKDNGFKFTML